MEEEQRNGAEIRDQYLSAEKRGTILQSEKEELSVAFEQAERARRQAEYEANDLREQTNESSAQANSLAGIKRKLEGELQALHVIFKFFLKKFIFFRQIWMKL